MYKPLRQRKKEELVELCEGFAIDIPEDYKTNDQLRELLKENDITDKKLRVLEADIPKPTVDDQIEALPDDVVVFMYRQNASFSFSGKVFTQEKPYVVLKKHDAKDLISNYDGFRVANRDEVVRFYS